MADHEADRLSIPSSSMSEEEERRNRLYDDEARNQDLSDADDQARDAAPGDSARPVSSRKEPASRE